MKQNVTRAQIVKELVSVLRDDKKSADYNYPSELRQGICGWCGVMAPLSRPAYIKDFGLEVVQECEAEARTIIEADRKKYDASEYHSFELEADRHKADGQPVPQEGSFMWGVHSGLKCDGGDGIYDEIRHKLYDENGQHIELVRVVKVFHVTEEAFKDPQTADSIACSDDCPRGGGCKVDGDYLDSEKMFFTIAAAVVGPDGRYYLVDNEGYSYARYVITPLSWREMFSEEVAQIEEENRRIAEEEAREAEEERQKRLADYKARCEKWEGIMTDITSYKDAEENARKKYGYGSKELKSAERKLHNVRRQNILAMCKTAFPGVKFSLQKHSGWGSDWELSWEDGPTEKVFSEKTNLELFSTYHDTFNGYDDSTGISYEEFTEFAHKYMGNCNSIDTSRKMSEEKKDELIAEIVRIVPELDVRNEYGYYRRCVLDDGQMEALEKHFKLNIYSLFGRLNDPTASEIALAVWGEIDYIPEAKMDEKISEDKPKKESNPSGLQLIDYSDRAVAIIGNTRDYVARLKELGGKFNGKLKCGAGWVFSKKREAELRSVFSL